MEFLELARKHLRYLETGYGCKVMKERRDRWSPFVAYQNQTTGVLAEYEVRDAYLNILLYRLENGKIIRDPVLNSPTATTFHGHALDDIVSLRSAAAVVGSMQDFSASPEGEIPESKMLEAYVRRFAENLRLYADDVLRGDFAIFLQVDRLMRRRIDEWLASYGRK